MSTTTTPPRRSRLRAEKFGVSIPDDEVKNLRTVGDAVAFIERAQG